MKKTCTNCKYFKLELAKWPCNRCNLVKNKWEKAIEEEWIPIQGELIEVKQHEYDSWSKREFACFFNDQVLCRSDSFFFAWDLYHQIKKPIIKYQWIKSGCSGLFKSEGTATGISAYYTDEEAANDPDAIEKIEWTRKEYPNE